MPAAADMRSILAVTGCETASAEIIACSLHKDCASRATAGTFAPPPEALVLPRKSGHSRAELCSVHRVNMADDSLGARKHIEYRRDIWGGEWAVLQAETLYKL
jgi:hypothetical protein